MSHESMTGVRELPGPLPAGERILWQGAPRWRMLFRVVFHGRMLAGYFVLLLALRAVNALWDGASATEAAVAALWLAPPALLALGMLALMAWLIARTTWYTITSRRVVMRIGVVLEVTYNFPFKLLGSVELRQHADGSGDIALSFMDGERIAYAHLWPHARPWRYARTEPMLRCVPDAAAVASLLARALVAETGGTAQAPRAAVVAREPAAGQQSPAGAAG